MVKEGSLFIYNNSQEELAKGGKLIRKIDEGALLFPKGGEVLLFHTRKALLFLIREVEGVKFMKEGEAEAKGKTTRKAGGLPPVSRPDPIYISALSNKQGQTGFVVILDK